MRLRLWPLRPNQRWSVKLKPGPMSPLPAPPPTARELIDVIGIGVSEMVGGVALTLLSLERYAEVSILLFRLVAPRPRGHDFFTPTTSLVDYRPLVAQLRSHTDEFRRRGRRARNRVPNELRVLAYAALRDRTGYHGFRNRVAAVTVWSGCA